MPFDAIIFDLYGTLCDTESLTRTLEQIWPGKGALASREWRRRQLEFSWLRTAIGRYADFETVIREALASTCETLDLPRAGAVEERLLDAYRTLPLFPDVPETLSRLNSSKKVILSNGAPGMVSDLFKSSGLDRWIEKALSVDSLRRYKPDPSVYRFAVQILSLAEERILFVSANGWDACGAKSFGLPSAWINRGGLPSTRMGVDPDHTFSSFSDLLSLFP